MATVGVPDAHVGFELAGPTCEHPGRLLGELFANRPLEEEDEPQRLSGGEVLDRPETQDLVERPGQFLGRPPADQTLVERAQARTRQVADRIAARVEEDCR